MRRSKILLNSQELKQQATFIYWYYSPFLSPQKIEWVGLIYFWRHLSSFLLKSREREKWESIGRNSTLIMWPRAENHMEKCNISDLSSVYLMDHFESNQKGSKRERERERGGEDLISWTFECSANKSWSFLLSFFERDKILFLLLLLPFLCHFNCWNEIPSILSLISRRNSSWKWLSQCMAWLYVFHMFEETWTSEEGKWALRRI